MTRLNRFLFLPGLLMVVAAIPAQEQPKAEARKPLIPADATVLRDIVYGPHERNKLDLYVPKSNAPLPLVIWVHGGGWEMGSKFGGGPSLALLNKGYAVASINYRLSRDAVFPAQIEDCKEAVRWLRSNAKERNLDPDHFGAWGMSAGGHLVALLGTTDDTAFTNGSERKNVTSRVQAVCDWFGPSDFLHWGLVKATDPIAQRPSAISRLLGGLVPDKMDLAKQASPVTYVSKNCPPFLIYHGEKDPIVPLQQAEALYEALKKAGVDSTLHVLDGAGHGGPKFGAAAVLDEEEAFFAKYLKAKNSAK
jgi:acetyl esterase/lipase